MLRYDYNYDWHYNFAQMDLEWRYTNELLQLHLKLTVLSMSAVAFFPTLAFHAPPDSRPEAETAYFRLLVLLSNEL